MPIRVDVLKELGGTPVSAHTNEAVVLKALHESSPPTATVDLVREVSLDQSAVEGALYRLSKKELVVREDGENRLAGDDAELLAEGLVPTAEQPSTGTP